MPVNVFTAPRSSHLKRARYDRAKDVLGVQFKSGAEYTYAGVGTQRWNAFVRARSKGSYLHRSIVPNYEDTKIR
jgi:hypothetical protein